MQMLLKDGLVDVYCVEGLCGAHWVPVIGTEWLQAIPYRVKWSDNKLREPYRSHSALGDAFREWRICGSYGRDTAVDLMDALKAANPDDAFRVRHVELSQRCKVVAIAGAAQ